ncbi:MAG: tetratricopeptide repeat protein [Pyrinomonadaceae bacterium]
MKFLISTVFSYGNLLAASGYFAFVLFLGVSAAEHGLSNYYADKALLTGSNILADSAISFEPENPNAYNSRGMISLRNKDYLVAAEAFEKAISLRDKDFSLWLSLGYCRVQLGDVGSARTAYEKALVFAPNYSQPNYRMGMLLFENGQYEQSTTFLSKAAEQDIELYPEILDLARKTFVDNPHAIENSVRPNSVEAKKIVARYMIDHNLMTDAIKAFLKGDELSKGEKNEFARYLISKQDFQAAFEVWLSRMKTDDRAENELIFDGGFEKIDARDESGFGWQIDQTTSAISVALDEKEFHSGSRAVRIKFAGNVELNRRLISQLTYVRPHQRYELKFFFSSPELISAGLPVIVVNDAVSDKLLGRSNEIQSTDARWFQARVVFVTQDTPAVTISLQRPSCNMSPCPLFGELILDDFSLSELPN